MELAKKLGIANRTENWKTARTLSPLFGERAVVLARRLGEPLITPASDVTLELFWKGARDYRVDKDKKEREKRFVESCRRLFPKLREKIKAYDGFRDLKDWNYDILSENQRTRLLNNLLNTEIDVMLESPGRLYIGEAKYKSGFHADSKLVLVHQLVRQYVTAKVLVDVAGSKQEVVPFVITENSRRFGRSRRPDQMRFMMDRYCLKAGNCLTWDEGRGAGIRAAGWRSWMKRKPGPRSASRLLQRLTWERTDWRRPKARGGAVVTA